MLASRPAAGNAQLPSPTSKSRNIRPLTLRAYPSSSSSSSSVSPQLSPAAGSATKTNLFACPLPFTVNHENKNKPQPSRGSSPRGPTMDPDSQASQNQRRIELQSPEDLAYLISNVRKAATAHLEEALPRIEGQREDRLREDIAALVNQVRYAMLISKNMGVYFLLISLYALLSLFFVRFVAARCCALLRVAIFGFFLFFFLSLFCDSCARARGMSMRNTCIPEISLVSAFYTCLQIFPLSSTNSDRSQHRCSVQWLTGGECSVHRSNLPPLLR